MEQKNTRKSVKEKIFGAKKKKKKDHDKTTLIPHITIYKNIREYKDVMV